MQDPTKAEIRHAVNHLSGEEGFDFDFEVACYWFANFYHGGQSTNLYSVLSSSHYIPGPLETGPDNDSFVYSIFEEIVTIFG